MSDPRLFYVTFGDNTRAAQERLQAQIRDALNASVNVRTVKDVIASQRDDIMKEVLASVQARAKPLGVRVVDVGLRRSEARRVGKGWGSTCRSGWSPYT